MKKSLLSLLAALVLFSGRLDAEDITWVSLNPVDAVDPADQAFTDILLGAGHSVTRFQLNAAGLLTPEVLDQFNASDLVIIGKASNSGHYDADAQIWNEDVTAPVLLMSGYQARMNRFGWVEGDGLVDTDPTQLVAEDPNHPVFTGIEFEEDGVTTVNEYNILVDQGISTSTNLPVFGGTVIARNASIESDPMTDNAIVAAEWPAGTIAESDLGAHTLAGDRYLFLGGSREATTFPIETSTMDLTADGRRMYFNMVQHALGLTVPEPGDFDQDGNVDSDDFFTLGNNISGHLDGLVGFSHGDMDLDSDVDLEDFGLFHAAYPAAVAEALAIPEPSTIVLLIVVLVAAGLARSNGRIRARLGTLLVAALALSLAPSSAHAQALDTFWEPTGADDFNVGDNWDGFLVPSVGFNEIGYINNGGTAFLDTVPDDAAGQLILGQAVGDSGTLEIRSGGDLTISPEAEGATPVLSGTLIVGQEGEGHLRVLRGGTLTARGLESGGTNSSIVLGEAGGSGTATLNINGGAAQFQRVYLEQTTRIIGPDVSFNIDFERGNALNLSATHNLIAEITGPSHSPINVIGTARLDGQLNVEFTGHTPAVGESWMLVDATSILGGFSDVNVDYEADPGQGFFLDYGTGGTNGMTAVLSLDNRLQLSVDRTSGTAVLENLTSTETFDINGYVIESLDGMLTPGGWTSLSEGDDDWHEFNPAANHMAELSLEGSQTIGPDSSVSLGPIFTPPGENGSLEDVTFTYHEAGGIARQGLVALVDLDIMPPDGIPGDYNGSGLVEQGDLDLVLGFWGSAANDVPATWENDPPEGFVDQAELDKVLGNWGSMGAQAQALNGAAVPEPATWVLAALSCLAAAATRMRR